MGSLRKLPFLARLAARYAVRHKGQTARAILGLLVSTAVLLAGLGLSDTISNSMVQSTQARYGPVDVVVQGAMPFNASLVAALGLDVRLRDAGAGSAVTLLLPGVATHPRERLAADRVSLRGVDAAEAAAFGPLLTAGGVAVPEPAPGEVVLTEGLAERLRAGPGDVVVLRIPAAPAGPGEGPRVATHEARVTHVVAERGRAGYAGEEMALLPLADLQAAAGLPDRVNQVLVRTDGDASALAAALQDAAPKGGPAPYQAMAPKAEALKMAQEEGMGATGFILAMSAFTLIAGVLLAFTLVSALVEERRSEIGIARAIGLTRAETALTLTLEGSLYAVGAALAGLAVGFLVLLGLTGVLTRFVPGLEEYLYLHVSTGSVLWAFALGTLLPLATIVFAATSFVRLDPARAIRGIPEDGHEKRRAGLGLAALLAVLGGLLCIPDFGYLMGVPLLIGAVAMGLRAFGRDGLALVVVLGAIGLIGYTLYTVEFPATSEDADPVTSLGRGLLLALALSALAVASPKPYDAIPSLAPSGRGARLKPPFLVAARYLVARRRAAGNTIAMIAIVAMVVTVMGTLFSIFAGSGTGEVAGYHIQGQTPLALDAFPRDLPADLAGSVRQVDFLPRVEPGEVNLTHEGAPLTLEWGLPPLVGATEGFAAAVPLPLKERPEQYATDRDAWLAVARGEALLLPDFNRETPSELWKVRGGDTLHLHGPDGNGTPLVVAGFTHGAGWWSMVAPAASVDALTFTPGRLILVKTADGVDPTAVAHRLSGEFVESGLSFTSVKDAQEAEAEQMMPFLFVLEAFLALGLFVGLAATGLLASRAVHERRREIGTLRALGFEEAAVRQAFLLESVVTALVGIVIGAGVGLLVAHAVWWREVRGEGDAPFEPPLLVLALFALAVVALSALSAWGPSRRAAKVPPALAVRHVE